MAKDGVSWCFGNIGVGVWWRMLVFEEGNCMLVNDCWRTCWWMLVFRVWKRGGVYWLFGFLIVLLSQQVLEICQYWIKTVHGFALSLLIKTPAWRRCDVDSETQEGFTRAKRKHAELVKRFAHICQPNYWPDKQTLPYLDFVIWRLLYWCSFIPEYTVHD